MFKEQRQKNLINMLQSSEAMSVSELSKKLKYSMMTIRRDLEYLGQKGIIRKIHGGAIVFKEDGNQPTFQQRIDEYSEEKDKIGKEAVKFIKDESIIVYFHTREVKNGVCINEGFNAACA